LKIGRDLVWGQVAKLVLPKTVTECTGQRDGSLHCSVPLWYIVSLKAASIIGEDTMRPDKIGICSPFGRVLIEVTLGTSNISYQRGMGECSFCLQGRCAQRKWTWQHISAFHNSATLQFCKTRSALTSTVISATHSV
jgi:hypothetical protein